MFTIQSLRSALSIAQDLHSRAIANDDSTMVDKWQSEIDRISRDLAIAKSKVSS